MQNDFWRDIGRYRRGALDRRKFLKSILAATGSCAAAHLFLESSGLAATITSEQEARAANVDAESIHYLSGSQNIEAYIAKPKDSGKHPAIIVIHDNRGLNEHVRDVARRFAAEGFVAMAPDLLSRAGGTGSMKTPEEARAAINQLPPGTSVEDLRAAYEFLKTYPAADAGKISSVGFGWGGWRSFMLATTLYRSVVFYGSTPKSGLENIQAPVLAHYGQYDFTVTGNVVWTESTMKDLGKKFTYYVYPKAYDAFFNDTGPHFDSEASKLAWARTLEFLRSAS